MRTQKYQDEFKETDNWEMVKKHPLIKVALFVGSSIAVLYITSFLLKAAAKTAESWNELRTQVYD